MSLPFVHRSLSRRQTRFVACIALATTCGLAACAGRPGSSDGSSITTRFIEEEPSAELSHVRTHTYVTSRRWNFKGDAPFDKWLVPGDLTQSRIEAGRLVLLSPQPPPKLIWPARLEARSVHVIEVELDGIDSGLVRLLWSDRGQPFSPDRMIKLPAAEGLADGVYRFPVASHPEWRGEVARLRLDATTMPNVEVRVGEIRALRGEADAEALAAALQTAWKVDLDSEIRNAFLAPPGLPIEREVEVPRSGMLRVGYGLQPGVRVPVRFRVFLVADDGDQQELSTTVLRPGPDGGRWHDLEVDLSDHAGRNVRLRLICEADADYDLLTGFPVWSNPVVIGQAEISRPNVVLVSIDTLRADHLSLYGHHRETSPNLDRWAGRRAVTFQKAVAAAPWTLPSHLSMLSGLDPLSHGTNFDDPVPGSLDLLAERLRAAGYETVAVTGGGYLHPQYNWAQGFDRYVYWPTGQREEELEQHMDLTLDWLEGASEPFFLFFHTYEVHSPYDLRVPFFDRMHSGTLEPPSGTFTTGRVKRTAEDGFRQYKRFVEQPSERGEPRDLPAEEIERIHALYDAGIAYMDSQLGRLLDRLEDRGLTERTILVFTSDHGEALGEHGLAAHSYLYDFNLLVPLVIAAPNGAQAGTRVDRQVRLVDVVPTLLDLLGLEVPQDLDGVSLAPVFEGRDPQVPREAWSYAASSNFGLSIRAADRFKYIYNDTAWPAVNGAEELYDLRNDPEELTDLAPGAADTGSFRDRVLERLARDGNGLRISFHNEGDTALTGTLSSFELLHPGKVKAARLPCRCVDWLERGQVTFEVPPHTSYDIDLKGRGHETLEVELRGAAEATPFRARLDLAEVARKPVVVRRGTGGWEIGGPEGRPSTGLTFEWRQRWSSGADTTSTSQPDRELQEQLRALGYVD